MSFFTLELVTTAPVVTFGPPSNTDAGDTLTVPFLLDKPEALTARLQLPDGRVVDGDIEGGIASVELPPDMSDGLATLVVHVRDDVLNERDWTLSIPVTGVATRSPRTYPAPGVAVPSLPPPSRKGAHVRSSHRVRTRVATSTVRVVHSERVGVRVGAAVSVGHKAGGRASTATMLSVARSELTAQAPITVATTHELSRLREGPQTELEIAAILGLL